MSILLNERIKCSDCPIRHRAVCARCDDDELARLEGIKSYHSFDAGQPMLWRGDELRSVSSVVKGIATLTKSMDDGRTQMVGMLLPSDFIGRPGREIINCDVTAVTDVVLCSFDRKAFERLLAETPHIAQRMMEMALDELDAARDWMVLLGRKTAREKLATFLEMLVRRSHIDGVSGPQITLPLTRDEIANYLGLTLETVSRQLNALKREGVLDFVDRRKIKITDFRALLSATGDDADGGMIV